MIMKSSKKFNISSEFESLFSFDSKEKETEHEAKMIMFRFLSELEKLNGDKPIKGKELAEAIGTSPSFITQLFHGNKLINLTTLAKIQNAFDFTYDIKAVSNLVECKLVTEDYNPSIPIEKSIADNKAKLWIAFKKPEYKKQEESEMEESYVFKEAK